MKERALELFNPARGIKVKAVHETLVHAFTQEYRDQEDQLPWTEDQVARFLKTQKALFMGKDGGVDPAAKLEEHHPAPTSVSQSTAMDPKQLFCLKYDYDIMLTGTKRRTGSKRRVLAARQYCVYSDHRDVSRGLH